MPTEKSAKNVYINFIVLSILVVLIGTVLSLYPTTIVPPVPPPPKPAKWPPANSAGHLPENVPLDRPSPLSGAKQ